MSAGAGERQSRGVGRRAGRARVIDLVVWDVLLLGAAVGLVFVDRAMPAPTVAGPPPAPVVAAAPAPTEPAPAPQPSAQRPRIPGRVSAQPEQKPEPKPEPKPAGPSPEELRAKEALAALAAQAHVLVEAGRLDDAVALYTHAPAELRSSHLWLVEAGPAVLRLEADLGRADAWRAALPTLEVLADAGRPAEVEARVALLPPEAREAPRVARERARAKAREGRPAAGFKIRGFSPDAARAEGRRCVVEGEVELARLAAVKDGVDAALAGAEAATGWRREASLTVKVLAEDAPPEAPGPAVVSVHARAADLPADLVDRARAAVARFALARGGAEVAGAPGAWVREGIALVVALSDASDGRPRLTSTGQAARRRALALTRALAPDALAAGLSGKSPIDPALAFGLCWAAGHQDPRVRPLRDAIGSALAAHARNERPAAQKTPTPDEVRALTAALGETLEHP